MTTTDEASYIDYETFLDPSFSATSFANTLVLATNDPSDTPLDLSTPLSRVLFDVQEIDTHIDTLTTKSALPLLEYTQERSTSSKRILQEVEAQVTQLSDGYKRLEKDVIERYEAADQVRLAADRLCQTLKLGRSVARCLQYARELESQMAEVGMTTSSEGNKRDGYRALVPAAHSLLSLRQLFASTGPGEEAEGLSRVTVVNTLRTDLVAVADRNLLSRAQQVVREFSMSSLLSSTSNSQPSRPTSTFAQTEDMKSRTTAALTTLYLLSPLKTNQNAAAFEPTLLVSALQAYLQTALTSSLASLSRALATLPTLDRTLLEISARCQNIVALETLLSSVRAPLNPLLKYPKSAAIQDESINDDKLELDDDLGMMPREDRDDDGQGNLLQPLLHSLDTSSLPSYFWRSLASALSARVQDILSRGGVSARTLRSNRDRVTQSVRECVARGSQLPSSGTTGAGGQQDSGGRKVGNWEREAAVMVGSIVGALGR